MKQPVASGHQMARSRIPNFTQVLLWRTWSPSRRAESGKAQQQNNDLKEKAGSEELALNFWPQLDGGGKASKRRGQKTKAQEG